MRPGAAKRYQIFGIRLSGRTIGSPGLHPNAAANCGMFMSGPFARHASGACGSTATWAGFGVALRRWLRNPRHARLFNVAMAMLLVATIIPIMV